MLHASSARERLAAAAEVGGLEVVEVDGQLEPHVLERADVVERPDAAHRPQRDARLLEARQRREREVLRVELVGGAEQLRLAPHDVLLADADPEPAVEELDVEVDLLELLLVLLAGAVVPRQLVLAEVLVEVGRACRSSGTCGTPRSGSRRPATRRRRCRCCADQVARTPARAGSSAAPPSTLAGGGFDEQRVQVAGVERVRLEDAARRSGRCRSPGRSGRSAGCVTPLAPPGILRAPKLAVELLR